MCVCGCGCGVELFGCGCGGGSSKGGPAFVGRPVVFSFACRLVGGVLYGEVGWARLVTMACSRAAPIEDSRCRSIVVRRANSMRASRARRCCASNPRRDFPVRQAILVKFRHVVLDAAWQGAAILRGVRKVYLDLGDGAGVGDEATLRRHKNE